MPEEQKAVSRIADLREKRGLTQLELSRRVGVTETTIQNWEKNRAGIEQIERVIKLCEALDCKPENLIEYVTSAVAEFQTPKPEGRLKKMRRKLGTDELTNTSSDNNSSAMERR
jgi:transcriptional regulator with XRE-family HTH domain